MPMVLKEKPDLDHFRILLDTESPYAKKIFLQMVGKSFKYLNEEDLTESVDFCFAYGSSLMERVNRRIRLSGIEVNLTESDFLNAPDISRRAVCHHEVVEMYELAKHFDDLKVSSDGFLESEACHRQALIAEYEYAIINGQGSEHLRFLLFQAKKMNFQDRRSFKKENVWGYKMARKKVRKENPEK
jgi:hypothetical protein